MIGEATELLGVWSPPSEARFTILGLAPTDVVVASKPVSGTSYRLGEAIEVAVTFGDRVLVNTSQGTPTLALTVGTQTRQASYVRGTGTTQLVFAYTVVAADSDTDGIAVAADALALNGGAITSVYGVPALLDHDAVAVQSGHGADGSQTPGFSLTGGVCGRTGQVRDKLVDLVNDVAANSAVTNCSLVTETHLGALTGTLDLSSASIAALKAEDFAGLRRNRHPQPRQQCADRAASAGVRAADGSDDAHARRQSRCGGVRAGGAGWPVWRVRRGVGRERDARGGGSGGRPGRSLGEQC